MCVHMSTHTLVHSRSKGLISLGGKGLVPWELGAQPAWLTGAYGTG